ncbi:hypothetical protein ACF3DV_16765 [Chlorogloeopsis fritschii PCC 9212]|uniref:hypothetical protein n=1 Tax=Chlorogloeopsis fritschii TaxID=1124 RepID=UPI00370DC1E1
MIEGILEGCNMEGASLRNAGLGDSTIGDTNLRNANLEGCSGEISMINVESDWGSWISSKYCLCWIQKADSP